MLFRVITWMVVIVIAYRFLTNYILPIFHITSATSRKMREMQEQMQAMERKVNEQESRKNIRKKEGDYIDYEELKP